MSVKRPAKVSTENKKLGKEVSLDLEVTVPESLSEAQEFYGGEEKLLEVIQAETVRRKINAARAVIREVEDPNTDLQKLATDVAEDYTPGRRGGFQRVEVSRDELEEIATTRSIDELLKFLEDRGARITASAE